MACILNVHAVAQGDYTDVQLRAFATTYIAQKEIVLPCDTMIRQWIHESGLSESRYGEILRSKIKGEEPGLSGAERASLAHLQEKAQSCDAAHAAVVRDLCLTHGLQYDRYLAMREAYRSTVAFQQRVRPWLGEEIKKRAHD